MHQSMQPRHNYLMHEIIEFCLTSSLVLDNWEQKYCQTPGDKPNHSNRLLRGRFFPKGKFKLFNSFFSLSVPCFSKKFVFYCKFVCRASSVSLLAEVSHDEAKIRGRRDLIFASSWETTASREGICGTYVTKINVVLWHSARQTLCRLSCLRSHVLRANCNFESKQANSITLLGRRPNNKLFSPLKRIRLHEEEENTVSSAGKTDVGEESNQ